MSRAVQLLSPTTDLDSTAEIAEMVRRFDRDVAQDDLLGLSAHSLVHARALFTTDHFERWVSLFHETVEGGEQLVEAEDPYSPTRLAARNES